VTSEPIEPSAGGGPIEGRCTSRSSRTGKPCQRYPVKGAKVCATHGGRAPQVKAAAKARQVQEAAELAVATYGLPREVAPDQALLEEVHRTAGHVAWLGKVVGQLEQGEVTWGLAEETDAPVTDGGGGTTTKSKAGVNVWVKLYQDERRHLAAVCRDALAAGIAERQVRLAEQQGSLLAGVIGRVAQRLLEAIVVMMRADVGDEQIVAAVTDAWPHLLGEIVPGELRKVDQGEVA
jgi:hypothetical protein